MAMFSIYMQMKNNVCPTRGNFITKTILNFLESSSKMYQANNV